MSTAIEAFRAMSIATFALRLLYAPSEARSLFDRAVLLSNAAILEDQMSQGSTVASIQATDLLEALRALGADATALCASVGLTEDALRDPAARVPSSLLLALLERAGRQLRDPLVGLHAGARVQSRGPLVYLLFSSPRVNDGLELLTRFARVPLDTQKLEFSLHDGMVDLTVDPGDPELERSHHAVDYIVGANLSTLRRAIPGFRLLEVHLTHAEVGDPGETARTFGCPVRFGRHRNALRFPDSTLDVVPAAANPAIAELLHKFTSALFDQVTSDRLSDRVADAIRRLLVAGLSPDRTAVARRLHVSERTLQRQLERESTTFKVLRDGVRLELAQALLSNRVLKVQAVAQELGFEEVASFSKAFARWTGHTPTGYRHQLYQSLSQ